jgi:alcohol dehydrogenase
VVGLGGVGLAALMGAKAAGAARIVAVDLSADKLALAAELGATDCLNGADGDGVAAFAGSTDVALEMAGSIPALELAIGLTRRGGTTVTVGLPHPERMLSIPAVSLVAEERTLKGSYLGSCVPSRDIPRFIQLYRRGRLPVDRLMSGTLGLQEINEAFDRLHDGRTIRQILTL